jgi:hypothetical protein
MSFMEVWGKCIAKKKVFQQIKFYTIDDHQTLDPVNADPDPH